MVGPGKGRASTDMMCEMETSERCWHVFFLS